MGMLVVLVPQGRDVVLRSEKVDALARLGVTSVSLARDDEVTAVVLEGWAFDPARPEGALTALDAGAGTRTLQPVAHMAVSPAANERSILR